jgi:hypothetical protein
VDHGPVTTAWCELSWTPWQALRAEAISATAPKAPGLYRVRRAGCTSRLVYIGQTGRTLRERLMALAAGANGEACPYNDPHTAAPYLWLLRRVEAVELEFSAAAVAADRPTLRGMEDMLLWRHRIELGCSTEANYGRFYSGYTRPTSRWIVRGAKRTPGRIAVADPRALDLFSATEPALVGVGHVLAAPWWERTPLSAVAALPPLPALYCVAEKGIEEPAYVGETTSLVMRATAHAKARMPLREPLMAYRLLPEGTPKHVLRELESDALGWHFWHTRRVPLLQYRTVASRGPAR